MERTRATPVPALTALLGAWTRFLEIRPGEGRGGAVWVARLTNERRAVEALLPLLPELEWAELTFRMPPDTAAIAALARSSCASWRRVPQIARRLHRRYEYFKVMRVAELVGYYARYLAIFRRGRFRLAVMSSHSNPHGIAFNLAARRCGVPVVLVTHGMPVKPVARLAFDLAVVHCEAARQTYVEAGCRMDRVLVHGRRQDHAPMPAGALPERLSVGIFLCKDVNEERVRSVVARLIGDPRVSRIVIRPHPRNLWLGLDAWISAQNEPRLCRSSESSVSRDLETTDVVLAGNSSVLVEAVTAGRTSAFVPGLDYGPADLHAFVARGLIYALGNDLGFDPDAMLRFYQRPGWPTVLRLFANVDEDEASVATKVAAALRELVGGT